ncbi:2-hydroxychromene-2-carboxylate isomerase [Limnohabitans sp.]|uniref:2-hydroxychromene-2-carboxylate isomerase n=1 Tax=Limnohabitans sp. TaxID=1907725 RepID=UPI0025C6DA7F|nr:2-hydroxychromene-2-carboxylate isomerase [Limnohabitans sp.]
MKTIHFYVDFISPYAWLGFDALPRALEGISHRMVHKPVLFAALLKHHGQLGPAEIPTKRDWTYRQVLWLARQQGTPLQLPALHPFNPLGLLRLATACDADGEPSRYVCEKIFRHVWCTGQDAADAERLAALTAELAPALDPGSAQVKLALQKHSQEAMDLGVFGVPSWVVDGRVFWGQDALPMLRAYLLGDAWFDGPDWQAPAQCGVGVRRS